MLITTTDEVHGREIAATLGLVRGSSIRTRHLLADITEWLRNLVGAELHHYTKMMAETREQALDRMVAEARRLGADAVVTLRFATSGITGGAAEMLAYGTAVRLAPPPTTAAAMLTTTATATTAATTTTTPATPAP
jgi:uncharacterized protein YbjQ (UPF0145 family)